MNETFQNAPLVEIVAELRWQMLPSATAEQAGNPIQLPTVLPNNGNALAAFFHKISNALGKRGFDRLEQLAPLGLLAPFGLPLPMLQPVMYRYRRTDEAPVLAQIGPGLFSVNALPPYKSWKEFRPMLAGGIEGLLEVLTEKPQLTAVLRYIDAFKRDLTAGRDAKTFATDILGFRLDLPAALRTHLADDAQAKMSFQATLPVPGMSMTITISDGNLGMDPVVLMNTDVRLEGPLSAEKQVILAALDKAHDLTHGTFIDMTRSIRDELNPISD